MPTQRRLRVRRAISKSSPSNPYKNIKRTQGKRSGLEVQIADALFGVTLFEEEKDIDAIPYTQSKDRKYHPDFRLPNGIIIEAKGWFKSSDRQKHLCIKYQHPALDIRFVFSNSKNKIGKKSSTTYAMWCERNGFKYADKVVPAAWIKEKCNHNLQPNGFTTLTQSWKCAKCGHTEETERDHQ
jgi:hypothetical protein